MTPAQFRDAMNTAFNLEEIEMLCFDLGLDFDNLTGKTKTAKISALVRACMQQNCIPELIAACQTYRPHVQWQWTGVQTGRHGAAQNVDEMVSIAIRHALNGDFHDATELLDQVRKIDPYHPGIRRIRNQIRVAQDRTLLMETPARAEGPPPTGRSRRRIFLYLLALIIVIIIVIIISSIILSYL